MYYSTADFAVSTNIITQLIKNKNRDYEYILPVPRGGYCLAIALSEKLDIPLLDKHIHHVKGYPLLEWDDEDQSYHINNKKGTEKILVVDDIIDSGTTRKKFKYYDFASIHVSDHYFNNPSAETKDRFTYFHKVSDDWINYFWEEAAEKDIEETIIRQLEYIGEDVSRDGLLDTPSRVVKSWKELYCGYNQKAEDVIKTFEIPTNGNNGKYDEIIFCKNIEFYSTCEHHMLPFVGKATIAYIPGKKIIGLSKLARLLEIYARRLQIQERICDQVTNDLMTLLEARAAACIIEAKHFCMCSRGVNKQNSVMVTSSMKGLFLERTEARMELMGLLK